MSMQINTKDEILIDGERTGLCVEQAWDGTRVYPDVSRVMEADKEPGRRGSFGGAPYQMPATRYNLTTDKFLNPGVAGVSQFETDIRALLAMNRQ